MERKGSELGIQWVHVVPGPLDLISWGLRSPGSDAKGSQAPGFDSTPLMSTEFKAPWI
jgi:hypothetical protein